jgi:DNA ligase-associated metallophosphoesterase
MVSEANKQAMAGAQCVEFGGERLFLLPAKAVWWPSCKTVFVADVHIGKAAAFRALGVPVPEATTQDTLTRLGQLVAACKPEHLVVLGDLLHSAHVSGTPALQALATWRAAHHCLDITLVRGNHDDRAGDPPAQLRVTCVDEPLCIGPLVGLHYPITQAGRFALAGHLHPCVRMQGRGRDSLRLPCFTRTASLLTLPAFGAFTGMHNVTPQAGLDLFPVAADRVFALPVG